MLLKRHYPNDAKHFIYQITMKLRTILSALLILVVSAVSAQLENGKVYRIKNAVYSTYLQENTISHAVTCADKSESEKYTQMWIAEGSNGKFALQNVCTGRYIVPKASMDKVYDTSDTDAYKFTITQNSAFPGYYNVLYDLYSEWYMSCAYGGNVLSWYETGTAGGSATITEWSFTEVAVTQEEIDNAREEYANAGEVVESAKRYYAEFKKLFTDDTCSELKTAYKAMTDEQLTKAVEGFPKVYKDLAFKIKNETWGEYEEEFRIAEYKPYSDEYSWGMSLKTNPYSPLSAPTGITCAKNDVLLIFVDKQVYYPSTLYLEEIKGNDVFASGTAELSQGLNVVTATAGGTLFIKYKVDTDRGSESRLLADYPNVKIHIEGGVLNGYFDKSRHTNEDWVKMQKNLLKHEIVNVKGEHALFHMHRDKVVSICPNNIYESINWWDTIVAWEKELMGATQYADRWNNPMLCVDGEGQYMFATYYYTYYEYSTLKDILPWKTVYDNPGFAWGPAHEIGHMNQGAINIVSCTEVSNNLFSNMVVHRLGKTTTRGQKMDVCYDDWHNKTPFPLRSEVFSKTRMYWQLYLYFHAAGHDTTFYPRLFEYLRETGLSTTSGVNGKFNQLRFAEACCEIAQMDLSEFFEVWGFFEPMSNVYIEDYNSYTVTLSAADAESSRMRMEQYPKKGGHLIFLEDRVKPSKRGDGVDGYRADWNDEVPVGTAGDVGQWEDYMDHSVKAEGYVFTLSSNSVNILLSDNANGAVGFKVYNNKGKLIGVSNRYKVKIPAGYGYSNIRVVAAQADGTDAEIPSAIEKGNEEQQMLALEAMIASSESILAHVSSNGKDVGKYRPEAVASLRGILDAAKEALENKDQSIFTYGQWATYLSNEINRIIADKNAKILILDKNYYTLTNRANKSIALGYYNKKIAGVNNSQVATSSDNRRWEFEPTGTEDEFYVKNVGSGLYITTVPKNAAVTMTATSTSNAAKFKVVYNDDETLSFLYDNDETMALNLKSDNTIIAGNAGEQRSKWRVRVAVDNQTAIEDIEEVTIPVKGIYDLTGRKLDEITKPGIYVIDGKKTLVK